MKKKKILLHKENDFVQTALYQRILWESCNEKKDVNIDIESVSVTNDKLKTAGIDVLNITNHTTEEIVKALGVDALLRTKITTTIMLHSTTHDVTKEIITQTSRLLNNSILRQAIHLNTVPIFLNTEIIDAKDYTTIWAFYKKRNLELHEKNTDMLVWLTKDVARRFPYRDN